MMFGLLLTFTTCLENNSLCHSDDMFVGRINVLIPENQPQEAKHFTLKIVYVYT